MDSESRAPKPKIRFFQMELKRPRERVYMKRRCPCRFQAKYPHWSMKSAAEARTPSDEFYIQEFQKIIEGTEPDRWDLVEPSTWHGA